MEMEIFVAQCTRNPILKNKTTNKPSIKILAKNLEISYFISTNSTGRLRFGEVINFPGSLS